MSVTLWHGDDFRREFLVVPLAVGLLLWRPLESLLGSLGPRGTVAPGNWAWAGVLFYLAPTRGHRDFEFAFCAELGALPVSRWDVLAFTGQIPRVFI